MTSPALIFFLTPPSPREPVDGHRKASGPVPQDQLPRYVPPGVMIVIRPCPGSTFSDVALIIESVAQRVVNAPILLWPDCIGRRRGVDFASRAWPLGVRCVVWTAEVDGDQLRERLADTFDWSSAVILWVQRRRVIIPPEAAALIRVIADHALNHRRFAELAIAAGPAKRTWYATFAAAGLSPPGHWFRALRGVRIALALQQNPRARVIDLALQFGFSSANVMSDRLHAVVGARPSLIRVRLGWEWMLATALTTQPLVVHSPPRSRR
jgi:hypothetical protein